MAEEAKLDATFFAFKKRDKRFVLTRAAVGYFILYLAICAIYVALTWNSLAALLAWYGGLMGEAMQSGELTPPPVEVMGLIPYAFLLGILSLVILAAFEAACLRWLVRGESGGGLLGLTAGADTWRVFAIYFLWLGLFIVFCIVVVLFYVLTGLIAGIGGAARIIAMLLGALAPLGFIALMIWGAVSFAPAAATSVARRRFAFFEAPRITKGRFWPLLGAFIILWLGYFVASIIVGQIAQIPLMQEMAPMMTDMMSGDTSRMGEHMQALITSPTYIAVTVVTTIVNAILGVILSIGLFGVNARAVLAADETQPGATPT